jgi:hypothetical protein
MPAVTVSSTQVEDFASKCLARRQGARVHTSLLMLAFHELFQEGGEICLGKYSLPRIYPHAYYVHTLHTLI